jgi:Protein of unknown function (DUF1640)
MNAHVSFNTHAFVKRLESSGMAVAQAEALADALGEIVFETTATKSDLRELQLILSADLKALEAKLIADLSSLEAKLTADLSSLEVKLTADLSSLEVKLTADLSSLEAKLTAEINALELKQKDMELRLMSRLGGMIAASTALTIAILGALITLKG